mmetsp:Transcript_19980/g.26408  ORF Transcript_19980/g.26408 Transcript_19980/m.26408 type:complete len:136 (+) Transcript_19980:76-483(+)
MKYKAEYAPSELLCPTYGTWVDFEVARKKLEKDSPIRHCCTLAYEKEDDADDDCKKKSEDDGGSAINSGNNNANDEKDMKRIEHSIKLDIGGGPYSIVTIGMLNDHGRNIVGPLVKEFVEEVGKDVSQRCIVKLC